ncbi:MAG TPA: sigma-70 family RNA polymerase sigma factor [Polyangia bacterium]|nr:sigma-70 family RNA polymerase sigma factor [Polyangia bacterium]
MGVGWRRRNEMVFSSGQGRLRLVTPPSGGASQTTEDAELARALIAGEARAAEMAWDRYAPLVHGIVSRALGPDAEVEDVTQEIFYRLFARIRLLRKPEALRSFVVSFAVRIVKWELRRRRARRWLTLSETGDVPDDQLLVMNVDNRYALRRLYGLLNLLSTRERLVLVLRHVEGMTLEETAEAMEISLATVKRTLRHAATRLSELVDADVQLRPPAGKRKAPK